MHRTSLALLLGLSLTGSAAADVLVLPARADNTLYESATGDVSNGAGPRFFAGANSQGSVRRAVLAFDVAGALPAGAVVTSVTLELSMSQTNAPLTSFSLHRALADWGEGASNAGQSGGSGTAAAPGDATWIHTFFPNATWTTPGGDFAQAGSASADVDGPGTYSWSSPALVVDVQAMLDQPAGDFGWLLKADDEGPSTSKRFDSRENADTGVRPRLVVEFDGPPCISDSFCFSSPNSSGGAAVLTFSGSCVAAVGDLTLQAAPVPAASFGAFVRGTNPALGTPFGNGALCVSGTTVVGAPLRAQAGVLSGAVDLDAGTPVLAGSTWHFQAWFRDRAAGGTSLDTSDGVLITFQ